MIQHSKIYFLLVIVSITPAFGIFVVGRAENIRKKSNPDVCTYFPMGKTEWMPETEEGVAYNLYHLTEDGKTGIYSKRKIDSNGTISNTLVAKSIDTGKETFISKMNGSDWAEDHPELNSILIEKAVLGFVPESEGKKLTFINKDTLIETEVKSSRNAKSYKISPKVGKVCFVLNSGETEVVDIKTGSSFKSKSDCFGMESISGNGRYQYKFDTSKHKICTLDLVTGESKTINWESKQNFLEKPYGGNEPNAKGFCVPDQYFVNIVDASTASVKKIDIQEKFNGKKFKDSEDQVERIICTADGSKLIFTTRNVKEGTSKKWHMDSKTGKKTLLDTCPHGNDCSIKAVEEMPGYIIATTGKDNVDKYLYRLEDGELIDKVSPDKFGFSKDGKWFYNASDDRIYIHNTETGEARVESAADLNTTNLRSEKDSILRWGNGFDSAHNQMDLKNGEVHRIRPVEWARSIHILPNQNKVVYDTTHGPKKGDVSSLCVKLNVEVAEDITKCEPPNCDFTYARKLEDLKIRARENIKKLNEKTLCSLPFKGNEKEWDEITPPMSTKIDKAQVELYLKRFSKPGGFDALTHLPVLYAALEYSFSHRENQNDAFSSELVLGALQGAYLASPLLFEHLVAEFPEVASLDFVNAGVESKNVCVTEKEKKNIVDSIAPYIAQQMKKAKTPTSLENWRALTALAPVVSELPKATKEEMHEKMTDSLRDGALTRGSYQHIFASKINYLISDAINPLFGKKQVEFTDLGYSTGSLEEGKLPVTPYAVGSKPLKIEGKEFKRNEWGFYSGTFKTVLTSKDPKEGQKMLEKEVTWKHGENQYTAKLTGIAEKRNVIPMGAKSPDYIGMWKDNILTEVHLIGASDKKNGLNAFHELLAYYKSAGVKFDEEKWEKIPDLPLFIKNMVESNQMDVMMKHAHSDGDDKNLFLMDKETWYLKGTYEFPGGEKEEVYLVWPNGHKNETVKVPNANFGEWIRTREKNGGTQLAYVNASCWSAQKATHELVEANSPLLLNIASTTGNYFFQNQSNGAEQLLLSGLRGSKTYEDIRKDMKKNEHYAKGSDSQFLFPDDPKYKEAVQDKLATPMRMQLEIFSVKDGKKTPYELPTTH